MQDKVYAVFRWKEKAQFPELVCIYDSSPILGRGQFVVEVNRPLTGQPNK